ncbi:hypothetical protein CEP53_015144, partial [Fusarium sp. AF-6]
PPLCPREGSAWYPALRVPARPFSLWLDTGTGTGSTGIGTGRGGHGHAKVLELSCIKIAAEGLRQKH